MTKVEQAATNRAFRRRSVKIVPEPLHEALERLAKDPITRKAWAGGASGEPHDGCNCPHCNALRVLASKAEGF